MQNASSSTNLLSPGDFVVINGLKSTRGRRFNSQYARVVTQINSSGRHGVVPYTTTVNISRRALRLRSAHMVMIQRSNLSKLNADENCAEHKKMYARALQLSLNHSKSTFYRGGGSDRRLEQLKELRDIDGKSMSDTFKVDLALGLRDTEPEVALELFGEVLQSGIAVDEPHEALPAAFVHSHVVQLLLDVGRPHQALDVALIVRGENLNKLRVELLMRVQQALFGDVCEERALKEITSLVEEPMVMAAYGSYCGRATRYEESVQWYERALNNGRFTLKIKRCIELDKEVSLAKMKEIARGNEMPRTVRAIDSTGCRCCIEIRPAEMICTRSKEKAFEWTA